MVDLMNQDTETIVGWLEANPDETHRLLTYLYNNRRMYEVSKILAWPMSIAYLLRPMGHLEADVFEAMAKTSALHAMFVRCWSRGRHQVDMGELHVEKEHEVPQITWLGGERVWVKTEKISHEADLWRLENEATFAKASTALTLLNFSYGCTPFASTSYTNEKLVVTSIDCGTPLKEWTGEFVPTVYLSMMALWNMRVYGKVHHFDSHLGNFCVMATDPTDVVWAWSFDTGLEGPQSLVEEHIQGFCLPGCKLRVSLIDGGFSSHVDKGRATHHKYYAEHKTVMGWDDLDVKTPIRLLGLELLNRTRKIKDRGWYFIPLLHFDDIPDAVVDIVSFFACLYARKVMRDECLKILGTLVRLAREDPEFGYNTFIEFMIRINHIIGGLTYIDRPRVPSDYVITTPEPGVEIDEMVETMIDSLFKDH